VVLMAVAVTVSVWQSDSAANQAALALADEQQLVVAAAGRDLLFDQANLLSGKRITAAQQSLILSDQQRLARAFAQASERSDAGDFVLLARVRAANARLAAVEHASVALFGRAGDAGARARLRAAQRDADGALDSFVSFNTKDAAASEAGARSAHRNARSVAVTVGAVAVLLVVALVLHVLGLLDRFLARIRADGRLLERRVQQLERARLDTLRRLALAAEYRDDDTLQHTERVGSCAALTAERMGLGRETVDLIRLAAPLHDIGKLGISDTILQKAGKLTTTERATMQRHTVIGAAILAGSDYPVLQLAERIALSHHERWDGGGYPHGLKGEAIPLPARIVAVADVFDALVHDRPYKRAWRLADALTEIRKQAGAQFDPAVVSAFMTLTHEQLVSSSRLRDQVPASTDSQGDRMRVRADRIRGPARREKAAGVA
jgi:putative nucleotidyltransferase with HDIG domain